jgi:tetratricopeptide (TPR) repeat protein/class 3 adenylate cyclase
VVADICDFTSRFESMAGRGAEGAERLSREVSSTLSGVVEACAKHGGWPVSFAGDAVTLVFPEGSGPACEACRRVHADGGDMLPLRTSVGEGRVSWDILPRDRWTWFSFQGSALRSAVRAADGCPPGGVRCLRSDSGDDEPDPPAGDALPADAFMPPDLFGVGLENGFRHVTSIFLSLENRRGSRCGRAFQELVLGQAEELGGFVSGLEAGDTAYRLLVVFGAPVSRENDADRADLLLQRVFASASGRVRAGAAAGLVFSGSVSTPLLDSYTVLGPSVNMAARLHDSAGWNSILCGPVFGRASDLAVREYRELSLRGISRTVSAHVLTAWKRREDTGEELPPLLERDRELESLRCLAEGEGGAVLLTGESGIGKTRLAEELQEDMEDTFFMNLRCQSLPDSAPDVFGRWLGEWLGGADAGLPEFRRRLYSLVDSLEGLDDPRGEAAADELLRAESVLAALAGLYWEGSLYQGLDPEGRFRNTVAVLAAFIRGRSLLGPAVICVDDLHAMGPDSAGLLGAVLGELGGDAPPLILLSGPGWRKVLKGMGLSPEVIDLPPLSREGSRRFLLWSLGGEPSEALLDWFHGKTEGIPFFMEHYSRMLESPVRVPDEEHFPGGLHALMVARLDRLGQNLRKTVLTASVLGREFAREILERLEGGEDLEGVMEEGSAGRIWEESSPGRYRFVHSLLRESAYRLQLHAERRALHGRAAGEMEALWGDRPERTAVIAHHMEMAGRGEKAAAWYMRAGRYSHSRRMTTACIGQLGKVLELSDEAPLRLEAHRLLYDLYASSGDWKKAEEAIGSAAEETGLSGPERASVRLMRANLATNRGRPEEALGLLEGMESAHPGLRPEAMHLRGRVLMLQGRTREAMEHLLGVHRELRDGGPEERDVAFRALGNACGCMLRLEGYLERAEKGLKAVLEYAGTTGDLLMETVAVGNLAVVYKYLPARMEDAKSMTRKHLELARCIGSRLLELQAMGNLGMLLEREGPSREVFELLEGSLGLARRYGGSENLSVALANLGGVLYRIGRHEEALELLEEAIGVCTSEGLDVYLVDYLLEKTDLLLDMGRLDEAEQMLARLDDPADMDDYNAYYLHLVRGKLRRLLGMREEAAADLRRGLELVEGLRERFNLLFQRYLLTGSSEDERACLESADSVMESAPNWEVDRIARMLRNREG